MSDLNKITNHSGNAYCWRCHRKIAIGEDAWKEGSGLCCKNCHQEYCVDDDSAQ